MFMLTGAFDCIELAVFLAYKVWIIAFVFAGLISPRLKNPQAQRLDPSSLSFAFLIDSQVSFLSLDKRPYALWIASHFT